MDTTQYRDLFVAEAREILTALNSALVALEKNPSDKERLNEIFRQAHTLKGMAATMSFKSIADLTHEMEEVLHLFREGKFELKKSIIDLLFECCDVLSELIENVAAQKYENVTKPSSLVQSLIQKLQSEMKEKEIRTKNTVAGGRRKEPVAAGFVTYQAKVTLRKECPLKEARAFIVVKTLEEIGTILQSKELYETLKQGHFGDSFELRLATEMKPSILKQKIEAVPDIKNVELNLVESTRSAAGDAREEEKTKESQHERQTVEKSDVQMVRVDQQRLDHLMNLVGELAIQKIRMSKLAAEIGEKPLLETVTHFGRIADELQSEMMQARLVPIDVLFNRLPRMIRDLAALERKEVDLTIEGGEIGLDRTILDKINEPLVHLLRNAVNHGIEPVAERTRLKKKQTGTVCVSAARERNYVVIEVSDDGRGIDPEHIKKTACDKGLLTKDEAASLNDEEAYLLITRSGFSTSNVVTQTSGRGIGMNAVKQAMESVGGSLKITSARGTGTTFTLKLPTMLAIVQALLVKVSDETYAIPMAHIVETIKAKSETVKRIDRHEVIPYRESVLPLIRLEGQLGKRIADKPSSLNPRVPLVVVEIGSRKAGLVVDDLLAQQEVVIKSTGERLKKVKGVAGATILGDGRVAMVLDIGSILQRN